ncbi:hypothetical protein LIER_36397 [Lithospermum erythrorhizon]|uniref:PB1-like domain-containing protein n=1 Tax=Lithospermum erythrorhizon TaxID=34254 RepID=A0AAV3P6P9_LITER
MGVRRGPLIVENPVYDADLEPDMLTIRMHHGSALLQSPHTRYVEGATDLFDYVDGSNLAVSVLKEFLGECRPLCDKNKIRFYHKYKENFDKGCRLLRNDKEYIGLLKFFKKGNEVDVFVQHANLEDMLRAEVAIGKIRQDMIKDDEDDVDYDSDDSEFGSSDESEGLVDEEYDMEDDDTLFELNVDHGVEEASALVNHTQLNAIDGDRDINSNSEGLKSDYDCSDGEADIAKLDSYPTFNASTDYRNPTFVVGMLFSSREELKAAIDTYNIKDARAIKYVKN